VQSHRDSEVFPSSDVIEKALGEAKVLSYCFDLGKDKMSDSILTLAEFKKSNI